MFNYVGRRLMLLAEILCIIGIIGSIIGGIVSVSLWNAIAGVLSSLFGSWCLYAFGQLNDDTHVIRELLEEGANHDAPCPGAMPADHTAPANAAAQSSPWNKIDPYGNH